MSNHHFRRHFGAVLVAGTLAIATGGSALADEFGWTSAPTMLRSSPTTRSRALSTIPRRAQLLVHQCEVNWCSVRFGGMSGFVSATAVTFDDAGPAVIHEYNDPPIVVAPPPPVVIGGYWGPGWGPRGYWGHGGWGGPHGGWGGPGPGPRRW